jgi:hypothetical protein
MSALQWCGRRWNVGAEDVFLPSVMWAVLSVPLLGVSAWSFAAMQREGVCRENEDAAIRAFGLGFVVVMSLCVAVDALLVSAVLRTRLCQPNGSVQLLLYARAALTAAQSGLTVLTTARLWRFHEQCFEASPRLFELALAIIAMSWFTLALSLCCACCAFNFGSPDECWLRAVRVATCACCWRFELADADADAAAAAAAATGHGGDFFGGIASRLAAALHVDGWVPSDVAVGLLLVKARQSQEARLGRKRLFRAAEGQPRARAAPPPAAAAAAASSSSSSPPDSAASPRQAMLSAPQLEAAAPPAHYAIDIDAPSDDPAVAAASGEQPPLRDEDWRRFEEARSLLPFAIGAYGWPLQGFINIWDLLCCRLAAPRLRMPPHCVYTDPTCCNASLFTFLRRTGVAPGDVLQANLRNRVGQEVFFVAVDRASRRVVVAVRGTMSLQDLLTDLDTEVAPLDAHGLPGHYTHRGILRSALFVRRELQAVGALQGFMRANPDFALWFVGHSLGAGIAVLLALLMRAEFPEARAVAFGCPLLLDEALAAAPDTVRRVTVVVHNTDVIPRASFHTLHTLRNQILDAYAHARLDSKFAIVRHARRGAYEAMVAVEGGGGASAGDERKAADDAGGHFDYRTFDASTPSGAAARVRELQALVRERDVPAAALHPLALPGLILHVCRWRPAGGGCLSKPPSRVALYVADRAAFGEILVDERMGWDHLPDLYLRYCERVRRA